jgi:hypothetical protein
MGRRVLASLRAIFRAEAIAIAGWRGANSFHDNYISDLGALACIDSGCSPLHAR